MADTPQTPERLCEQCKHRSVPPTLGSKPRRYCSRSCVQRAYEARKTQRLLAAAVEQEKERQTRLMVAATVQLERERAERERLLAAQAAPAVEARGGKSREDAAAAGAKSREDGAGQQERPGKSREDAPAPRGARPKRVTDYLRGAPKMGW
ncbi:hypothetical protein [Streptomyces lydicamycinicus]|uniref:hypothetical protein n=1 Tax=Streptomyces lydicamycinicus TaxID=1546107 RepID=UPI003C2F5A35